MVGATLRGITSVWDKCVKLIFSHNSLDLLKQNGSLLKWEISEDWMEEAAFELGLRNKKGFVMLCVICEEN